MLKHRLQLPQTAPSMSPAHSYTLIQADDDDDSDICPVCDGECTCHKAVLPPLRPATAPTTAPGVPLSMAELSLRYAAASSVPNSPSSGQSYPPSTPSSTPAPAPKPAPKPSLKIKLTVPPSMLAKRKFPLSSSSTPTSSTSHIRAYKSAVETTSDFAVAGYQTPEPSTSYTTTKKRGRPPKASASARPHPPAKSLPPNTHISKLLHPKSAPTGKHPKASTSVAKVRQSLKARAAVVKKTANKRRRVVSSDEEESSLSDVDMAPPRRAPYADDDAESGSFPTFVSASALSSMSSDASDSSSSLSEFDSDSSIEAEEENFILADVQDKARLKREMLGHDDPSAHKKRNNWVIRPRKKSVGPSDVEMDVDSDATEDDDEEEGEDEDDEDADETEEDTTMTMADPLTHGLGLPQDEYEESESTDDHRRYTGHATGWSDDDDESSFDADIFFANLSDSDTSDSDRSPAPSVLRRPMPKTKVPFAVSMGEDGDQSDISGVSESTEGARGHVRRATLESLPFEVTESWDGQLVFTNGIHDSQGLVELEFEADAREFGVDCSAAPSSVSGTDPAESHDDIVGSDVDMSDGGYEEESGGEGSGDTTDEELVGPDELPNARAMKLFSLPLSVSAIDPLSTVSSPAVSPGRTRILGSGGPSAGMGKGYGYKWPGWSVPGRGRGRSGSAEQEEKEKERERRRRMWGGEGVRAADILEGRVLFWDSDEQEHDRDDRELRRRRFGAENEGAEEDDSESVSYDDELDDAEQSGSGEGKSSRRMRRERRKERMMMRKERRTRDQTPCGPRQGVFVPSGETRQAVIGEETNGAAVPSPHPRFSRRGRKSAGRFSTVEHLLRRHLFESVSVSQSSSLSNSLNFTDSQLNGLGSPLNLNSTASAQSPVDTADMCASLDLLFSSAAQVLSGGEEHGEADTIQLDDVLDASFLADAEPSAGGSSGVHAAPADAEAAAAAAKGLSRWDLISVGAFRQTREASWDGRHTPAASADFGNVMKPAPMSAMMWQNQALAHHHQVQGGGQTAGHSSRSGVVKGSKHAKRRQIMMGGGSAMCSPLILPSSGPASTSVSAPASLANSPASFTKQHQHQQQDQQQQQKSRRELRRERKLLKKNLKVHAGPPPHHTHNGHGVHQFHSHHHHPNAKLRGAGAVQRSNFFGGAVPPLNL